MSETPQVHLAIGSSFHNIELVQVVVEEALRRLDLDPDDAHWIGIAVREAVANAVKHGNQQNPDKKVEVDFTVDDDELVIQVHDEGGGFVPEEVDDPLEPENMLKSSGRGIFYMKRFMDEIEYSFRPDGGTVVTLRKKLGAETVGTEEKEEDNG